MSRSRAERVKSRVPFTGFNRNYLKNFFIYPNLLEEHWHYLSGSEQKVLDFTLRQTIGFRKHGDYIALSQFANGIGKKNRGTGLSVSQVRRAIKGLEEKGFITVSRPKGRPSWINLVLEKLELPEKITVGEISAFREQVLSQKSEE
jgi:hypothetical protein